MNTAGRDLVAASIAATAAAYGFGRVPPRLLLAQSQLETGGWTSQVYNVNRNAWGMRFPSQRPTLAVGEANGHAVYGSVVDSTADYFARQRAFDIPNTSDAAEYMAATAASGYATDPFYLGKWGRLYFGPDWNVPRTAPGFVVLMAALYLYLSEQ